MSDAHGGRGMSALPNGWFRVVPSSDLGLGYPATAPPGSSWARTTDLHRTSRSASSATASARCWSTSARSTWASGPSRSASSARTSSRPPPTSSSPGTSGQTVLRSESESHFLPADWPTFAQLDAWARKDLSPLFRSAGRKFNPGRAGDHGRGRIVADRLGWKDRIVGGTHVGWIVREPGPPLHFSLYDEDAAAARPRQARDDRRRPRAAGVPRHLRQGAREPARCATGSCRPTSPSSTTRAAATSSSAPASRRSTSGPTASRRARSASRCGATRTRTSRT